MTNKELMAKSIALAKKIGELVFVETSNDYDGLCVILEAFGIVNQVLLSTAGEQIKKMGEASNEIAK